MGSEWKKDTDIAKKAYQSRIRGVHEFDGTINKDDKKKQHLKSLTSQIQYISLTIVCTNIMILNNLRVFLLNQSILL